MAARASIVLATWNSADAVLLFVNGAKSGATVEFALARIGFIVADSVERLAPIAFAAFDELLAEPAARICLSAARRAALAALALYPASANEPLTGIAERRVDLPVVNSTVPPSDVTTGNAVAALSDATLSAMRPPQPVPRHALETELCHCACWSECEYSDNGTCPAMYCALVVGCTSVPTLARTASLRWLKSVCELGQARMQAERRAAARRLDRQQRRLRELDAGRAGAPRRIAHSRRCR